MMTRQQKALRTRLRDIPFTDPAPAIALTTEICKSCTLIGETNADN